MLDQPPLIDDDLLEPEDATSAEAEGALQSLDLEALKRDLSKIKRREEEDDAEQWRAAFGDNAQIMDASVDTDDGDEGFEFVGTF